MRLPTLPSLPFCNRHQCQEGWNEQKKKQETKHYPDISRTISANQSRKITKIEVTFALPMHACSTSLFMCSLLLCSADRYTLPTPKRRSKTEKVLCCKKHLYSAIITTEKVEKRTPWEWWLYWRITRGVVEYMNCLPVPTCRFYALQRNIQHKADILHILHR